VTSVSDLGACATAGEGIAPATAAPAAIAWTRWRRLSASSFVRSVPSSVMTSLRHVARIEGRFLVLPTTRLANESDQVVDVLLAQRVFVGRHTGTAFANLFLDSFVGRG